MIIGVPVESAAREKRTALTPRVASVLRGWNSEVRVERGAGLGAGFTDAEYEMQGAVLSDSSIWRDAHVILKVAPPARAELEQMQAHATLISFFKPHSNQDLLAVAAQRELSVLAMDCIPRISTAQSMDALSTMSNIAGYKAVIAAADMYGGLLPGQITSAGRSDPAEVLVIGAGVAGLSAISAARGLGAEVYAFDTRAEAAEQVRSVGGRFLALDSNEDGTGQGGYAKQMSADYVSAELALIASRLPRTAIVITTALVPGRKAPVLITRKMVESMAAGSVIFDLAAETGGNCELTVADEVVTHHGVKIAGFTDLPSQLAVQASTFYSNNLLQLLKLLTDDGQRELTLDLDNKIVSAALICQQGTKRWPPPQVVSITPQQPSTPAPVVVPQVKRTKAPASTRQRNYLMWLGWAAAVAGLFSLGSVAPPDFLERLTVFVLACFVGWQVVWNVTPALHTPLMSVTNAISGIIVLGAMLKLQPPSLSVASFLAIAAVLMATVNVAGGFFVTWRMLKMFRK